MGWLHSKVEHPETSAPWEGPFAPPPPAGKPTFNPMVKTAGELAPEAGAPAVPVAPATAAAAA